jgi:hypothetical protein
MKKIMFILAVGVIAGSVAAQEASEITLQGDVGLYSAYVWRGQVLNNGMVAQPGLTVAKGGLSFNVWGNYNMDGKGGASDGQFTEYDFTLAYRLPEGLIMDGVDLDVGIIKYEFAGDWSALDNTEELFAVLTLNNVLLTPVLSAYYDINEAKGWYGNFALSQGVEISDAMTAEIGASIGYGTRNYNKAYFTDIAVSHNGSGAVNDYNIYASAEYALNDKVSLGALLQYTYLDGGVANDIDGMAQDLVWGGVSLSYKF